MIRLGAWIGIFWQGAFAPSIGSAYTMHVEVDVEMHESITLKVAGVAMTHVELLVGIVVGADAERLKATDGKLSARSQSPASASFLAQQSCPTPLRHNLSARNP